MLKPLIQQLAASEPLTEAQVRLAVEQLVEESVPAVIKADFLTQLARKGETAAEIAAFARELRARAIPCALDSELRKGEILDVVGTGGDGVGTFNISTTVALLAAAAGVMVAKHGNRASTSPTGSADVLEALGIPSELGPQEAIRSLREHGFAFFFAPKYHPAFRHIIPARKLCAERGQRTIFNFLGPLLNPARPSAMLVGVPRPDLCEPLAHVLQALGVRRAMVVCGEAPHEIQSPKSGVQNPESKIQSPESGTQSPGNRTGFLDELSSLGPNTLAEFYQENALPCSALSPEAFPLQPAGLADLRGGGREANAAIIRRIFSGEERGPKRDVVLLNAAAALFVAGRARNLSAGWELAGTVIDSGAAARKLDELRR